MHNSDEDVPAVTRQQLIDDLNLVLSDVDALIKATANQRAVTIKEVRTKAADSVAAMKLRMIAAETGLLNKGKQASKAANDYIRENPWRHMGIVAGVGLLVGLLIGRR